MALADRAVSLLADAVVPASPTDWLYIVQETDTDFPKPRRIAFENVGGSVSQSVIDEINDRLTALEAALGGGGHLVRSPDDSVQNIVIMEKADYDLIAPGVAGTVYITKPEA